MSKPVSMTDLINALGNENIRFQNLDHSLISADWSAKKGSRVTFGTDVNVKPTPGFEGLEKLGLILWLDRDLVEQTMARLKAEA